MNTMTLTIASKSINESFARGTVAAFAAQVDPTLDDINDIKTAVSEAVTNSVVHANCAEIRIEATLYQTHIDITITDTGKGIQNIDQAMQPFSTSKPSAERSGMGFTVMQSFMDKLDVKSIPQKGTTIKMTKYFNKSVAKEA